jgi:hypothetical protein
MGRAEHEACIGKKIKAYRKEEKKRKANYL